MASVRIGLAGIFGVLAVLASALPGGRAAAHDIQAAVADVEIAPDAVYVEIELALEAYLADIDLADATSTVGAEGETRYDVLRALSPEELEAEFRRGWPEIADEIRLLSGETRVDPTLTGVDIPDIGDLNIARLSTVRFEAPIDGPVRFGWAERYGALVIRQTGVPDDQAYTAFLLGGALSEPVAAQSNWRVFSNYVAVGFDHIIPRGLDHILFVLGLFFFSMRFGPLLWQITAFTLAHTITLALAAFQVVRVAPEIVEPLIAASIVYVAVENVFSDGRLPWWRPLLVFAFGLLHGLGFASVLGEWGVPSGREIPALVGFNVGVEFGQIAVVSFAYILLGYWFGERGWWRPAIAIPASIAIAAVGAYWVIERTVLAA